MSSGGSISRGGASGFGQLLAVQWQAEDAFADPDDVWHCNELDGKGARRTSFMAESVSFMPATEVVEKRVALGHREEGVYARLREWLGQPRGVTPCPALHGLREFSFAVQLSAIRILCEISNIQLAALLGAGYQRGICATACSGSKYMEALVWLVPMSENC